MYQHKYIIPNNYATMYRNHPNDGDRFLLTPFLFGGLAGTALGFGIANNNQINRPCCGGGPVFVQPYPYPYPVQQPYNYYSNKHTNTTYYNY